MADALQAILIDSFTRIRDYLFEVLEGMTPDQLAWRPQPDGNSIGWLAWHLTRIQDDHLAGVSGAEQVWVSAGWCDRFGLPFSPPATGYGHRSPDVDAVRVSSVDLLTGYHQEVFESSVALLERVTEPDLGRIVDSSWDPPVTLAVRLVSVIADDLEHVGQAAYVRGLLERA